VYYLRLTSESKSTFQLLCEGKISPVGLCDPSTIVGGETEIKILNFKISCIKSEMDPKLELVFRLNHAKIQITYRS